MTNLDLSDTIISFLREKCWFSRSRMNLELDIEWLLHIYFIYPQFTKQEKYISDPQNARC